MTALPFHAIERLNRAVLLLHKAENAEVLSDRVIKALHSILDIEACGLFWQGFLGVPFRSFYDQPHRVTPQIEQALLHYAYVAAHHPFVRVFIPQQDVTHGVLTLLVIESKVGKVEVLGSKWYRPSVYTSALKTTPGAPLDKSRLDADSDWINRNAYHGAEVLTRPGETFGTTDVVLQARERFPLGAFFSYDNAGSEATGQDRLILGLDWETPFGHHLSYQETDSPDFSRYLGHAATYEIPLPWRHIVRFNASYATVNPDVAPGFSSNNYAEQAGVTYEIPLPAATFRGVASLTQFAQAGFEFKQTNNNLEFGGAPVTDNTTQIFGLNLAYCAQIDDPYGHTSLTATLVYSPGSWTADNRDSAFNSSRAGAKADFVYGDIQFQRETPLPCGFSHVLTGYYQLSDQNLLGSEQLGLGGESTVRGYDEGVIYGDEGGFVRNELYLPSFAPGQLLLKKAGALRIYDHFRPLAFYDWGVVNNKFRLPGEPSSTTLSSAGIGFRYELSRYVSASFDYGWQLEDAGFAVTHGNSRGHFSVTVKY